MPVGKHYQCKLQSVVTAMWVSEAREPRISKIPHHKVHWSRPVSLEVGLGCRNKHIYNQHQHWPDQEPQSTMKQSMQLAYGHMNFLSTYTSCIDSFSRHSRTILVKSVYTAASQQMTLESGISTSLCSTSAHWSTRRHGIGRETCMINVIVSAKKFFSYNSCLV